MDTAFHALIGFALAGMSGHTPAITDPVFIATILGAQAPDLDIITQLKGSMTYLKQHRVFSHSIPGIAAFSALIATGMHFFCNQWSWYFLFGWSFIGGLSHILCDYLNTHGAALLWPFRKERLSCHLLNVFDPVLLLMFLLLDSDLMATSPMVWGIVILSSLYLMLRLFLKQKAYLQLKTFFMAHKIERILIMPSLRKVHQWDFVVQTPEYYIIGQIKSFFHSVQIITTLPNLDMSSRMVQAEKTFLGQFFKTFSPFVYFEEQREENAIKIYDLRYSFNQQFLHSATILFNQANLPATSYMHSYGRTIKVPC